MPDPTFDEEAGYADVVGLPGVAVVQNDAYFDSAHAYVATPTADTELVVLKSSLTGDTRRVTLAELKTLVTP